MCLPPREASSFTMETVAGKRHVASVLLVVYTLAELRARTHDGSVYEFRIIFDTLLVRCGNGENASCSNVNKKKKKSFFLSCRFIHSYFFGLYFPYSLPSEKKSIDFSNNLSSTVCRYIRINSCRRECHHF